MKVEEIIKLAGLMDAYSGAKTLASDAGTVASTAVGGIDKVLNSVRKKYREISQFNRLVEQPDLADIPPEQLKPYWKLTTKFMPQVLDMDPALQSKLLLQLVHMGTVPPETLKILQEVGGTSPRYRKDEVRKEKGFFDAMSPL
jgi:hypothetical protein